MAQMLYQELAERIINAHYNNFAQPEATITPRFIADRIAAKVAKASVKSAYGNSNANEATYSNDQFISVFNSCPLLTDSSTGNKYCVLAATPSGLPMGREIAQVSFTGYPNVWCVPMPNRYAFISSQLPPIPVQEGIQTFVVEGGNIVFQNLPGIITGPVNMKLVGATLAGDAILTQFINCPKDTLDEIFLDILNELATRYKIPISNVEVGEPS